MPIRTAAPALLLVLVLAACGGSSAAPASVAAPGTPATPATGASATGQPTATSAPAGNGTADCTRILTAAEQLVEVQVYGQLKTLGIVEGVRDGLDPEAFVAAMQELHALDSYVSPLGDPKAAIDAYEKAGKAAQVLLAMDPITQDAVDAYYTENVGSLGKFLGQQVAISGAIGEAGC